MVTFFVSKENRRPGNLDREFRSKSGVPCDFFPGIPQVLVPRSISNSSKIILLTILCCGGAGGTDSLSMGSLFGRWLRPDNSNETAGKNNARESGLFLLVPHSATILDKTVEKIAFLGGIFSELHSRPILPLPPSSWKQCCWVFKRKPDP